MKLFAIVFLFFFGLFFTTPFKMVNFTQQKVVGGRMESGISTVYEFKAIAKKDSDKLSFEDLWVGTTYYAVKASHQKADNSISNDFSKGDTILFRAVKRRLPDESGDLKLTLSDKQKHIPLEYTGKALLGYTYKGKKHYFPIEEIKVLEEELRP